MDIVYIFKFPKNDKRCLELKYSLRSISLNLKHDNVFIVGDKPKWIRNVTHIPFEEKTTKKMYNISCKLNYISNCKTISEDFISMWDDVYILNPIDIKIYGSGDKLSELLNKRKRKNSHWKSLNMVSKLYPNAYNYDVHHPYVYNKTKLKQLFKKHILNSKDIYSIRSLYCNMFNMNYTVVTDEKCSTIKELDKVIKEKKDIFSSNALLVNEREYIEYMDKLFNQKSKYEK